MDNQLIVGSCGVLYRFPSPETEQCEIGLHEFFYDQYINDLFFGTKRVFILGGLDEAHKLIESWNRGGKYSYVLIPCLV